MMKQISPNLFLFRDTCNVYVLRCGREAVLIDFGSGAVLDETPALDIDRISVILMTHHHRDQGQGLPRAVERGIPIWVPFTEQDLFAHVDEHWQARPVYNNYNNRQDRFSLLEPVTVAGLLRDHTTPTFAGIQFKVLPTPGHTTGSITLLAEIDGQRVGFSGDLIAAPGKVWSLAATQWSYNGAEGIAAGIPSLKLLQNEKPDLLLPSHGHPIHEADAAIDGLVNRLWALLHDRSEYPSLFKLLDQPFDVVTPHLLWNMSCWAHSYVLLSQSGKALLIDYGYDFSTSLPAGTDRASRRPWLYSLPKLKSQFGVTHIHAAILTHYHDDHVAGLNLLREVEGAQVWAAENFADILQRPDYYDLPCLWYDPIPVDRVLPLETPIHWEEYTLTCYPLPGHTRHAVAVLFEVDGKRVLAVGDQYQGKAGLEWNYVYNNRFHLTDYPITAALYRRLAPDLIISGHWNPHWVEPDYFDRVDLRAAAIEAHHRSLLPLEEFDLGGEDRAAYIHPYQIVAHPGEDRTVTVEVLNPFNRPASAVVQLVIPPDWTSEPREQHVTLEAHSRAETVFTVKVPPIHPVRRVRIAADLTIDHQPLGQMAEALVTIHQ